MNKKYLILFCMILLVSVTYAIDEKLLIRTMETDKLNVLNIGVIKNNSYYSNYFTNGYNLYDTPYRIVLYQDNNPVYNKNIENLAFTLIDFTSSISRVKSLSIFKENELIYETKLNFCNNNNICEPCLGVECINYENEITCQDCEINSDDNYCNIFDDNICDLDCVSGYEYIDENLYEDCFEEKFLDTNCEDKGGIICPKNTVCDILGYENNDVCCLTKNCIPLENDEISNIECAQKVGELCNYGSICSGEFEELSSGKICCTLGKCIDEVVIADNYPDLDLDKEDEIKSINYSVIISLILIVLIVLVILYLKKKKILTILTIFVLFSFLFLNLNVSNTITGRVVNEDFIDAFPQLFSYNQVQNLNLLSAIIDISAEFKTKGIKITPELLAAVIITLEKEVGGYDFLPYEEYGDYCAGPSCTYKINGQCRKEEYEGGCDYKGRGFIQITHKSNYEKYGGSTFVSDRKDECECVGKPYCSNSECAPAKALEKEFVSKIFVSYFIDKGLIELSNNNEFSEVGFRINGEKNYAENFEKKALEKLKSIKSSPEKLNEFMINLVDSNTINSNQEPLNQNDDIIPAALVPSDVFSGDKIGYYYLDPSIKVKKELDIKLIYNEISFSSTLIKEVLDCLDESNDYKICTQKVLDENNKNNWHLGNCPDESYVGAGNSNIIKFCVETGHTARLFENSKYVTKPLNLKFALTIAESGIKDFSSFEYDTIKKPIISKPDNPLNIKFDKEMAEEQIKEALMGCYGSVYFTSLSTNDFISYNNDALLNPLSTFKGPLAVLYYMTADEIEWDEANEDMNLMLVDSNNHATTRIFSRIDTKLGGNKVMNEFLDFLKENQMSNYYMYSWNYKYSEFDDTNEYNPSIIGSDINCISSIDKEGEDNEIVVAQDCEKVASTKGFADFYKRLYQEEITYKGKKITQKQKEKIMSMLKKDNSFVYGFTKSFETGNDFYVKGGSHAITDWKHSVFNDAGIIITDIDDYAFSVMVMDCETDQKTSETLNEIAKIISNNIKEVKPDFPHTPSGTTLNCPVDQDLSYFTVGDYENRHYPQCITGVNSNVLKYINEGFLKYPRVAEVGFTPLLFMTECFVESSAGADGCSQLRSGGICQTDVCNLEYPQCRVQEEKEGPIRDNIISAITEIDDSARLVLILKDEFDLTPRQAIELTMFTYNRGSGTLWGYDKGNEHLNGVRDYLTQGKSIEEAMVESCYNFYNANMYGSCGGSGAYCCEEVGGIAYVKGTIWEYENRVCPTAKRVEI